MSLPDTRLTRWGLSVLGIVVLIGLWEFMTTYLQLFHPSILPSPSMVLEQFILRRDLIANNVEDTVVAATIGFLVAVISATVFAILFTLNKRVERALMPLVVGGNSIPRVALAPLFVFYLGESRMSLWALAAWIAFFPMFINAFDGFARIDSDQGKMLAMCNASTWQEYRYVRIPNGMPRVFDGMKISIILAMIGAIVGEFVIGVGGMSGLGNLALIAMNAFNTALVFATVFVAGIFSTLAIFLVYLIQVRVVFWEDVNFFTAEM